MRPIILMPVVCFVAGCASMMMGTTQKVTVHVVPESAECQFFNKSGDKVASMDAQNKTVTIPKSSEDMTVTCHAKGYSAKTIKIASKFNPGALLIAGAGDIGTGAIYKFPDQISIELEK